MNRPEIRCEGCRLNQFVTDSGMCRRCKAPLFPPEVLGTVSALQPGVEAVAVAASELGERVSERIRETRKARGWSQRDLAKQMDCQRTYLSKVENKTVLPTLPSLMRFAAALKVSPAFLVSDEPAVLIDPFVAELAPLVPHLNEAARTFLLLNAKLFANRGSTGKEAA